MNLELDERNKVVKGIVSKEQVKTFNPLTETWTIEEQTRYLNDAEVHEALARLDKCKLWFRYSEIIEQFMHYSHYTPSQANLIAELLYRYRKQLEALPKQEIKEDATILKRQVNIQQSVSLLPIKRMELKRKKMSFAHQ